MGTTLTGTTPQDTYDSLIKVTDNGPLSGTAKYLSDGLGNDSALALSTSRVGINQSNPTVARLEIVESTTAEALRVDGSGSGFAFVVNGGTSYKSAIRNASVGSSYFSTAAPSNGLIVEGNVGIGTSSPQGKLEVKGDTDYDSPKSIVITHAEPTVYSGFIGLRQEGLANSVMAFGTRSASVDYLDTLSLSNGNVGIGTSSPASKLSVAGSADGILGIGAPSVAGGSGEGAGISSFNNNFTAIQPLFVRGSNIVFRDSSAELCRVTPNGLTFNGDTAAANALDDYEEGTFTAALAPSVSGTITLTAGQRTCKYTKIGNKVSITGYLIVSTISSPVGGSLYLQGLPFTIASGSSAAGSANATFFDAPSYSASIEPTVFLAGGTQIDIVKNASLIGAGDEFYVSATYFV